MAEQQTDNQADVWRLFADLASPFDEAEIRIRTQAGRDLQYVTARTVMNRLDDIVGPHNWWDEYIPMEHSVLCKLTIRLPDGSTITKSDAGGFAGMQDPGDDDKSGYSDAFKRAAVKLGVGRHLYRDGIPEFARSMLGRKDDPALLPEKRGGGGGGYQRSNGGGNGSYQSPRQQADRDRQQGREAVNQQFGRPSGNGNGGGRQAGFPDVGDPGRMPTSGGGLFAWSRKKEDEGYQGTLRAVSDLGKKFGFPDRMKDWNPQDIEQVWGVITGGGGAPSRQPEPAMAGRGHDGGEEDGEDIPF